MTGAKLKSAFTFLKQLKIKKQLYLIYFVAVFLPIMIIGSFLLINTSRLLTNYHRDLLESDNLRVKTILFEITTQIYNISESIAYDDAVGEFLAGEYYLESAVAERAEKLAVSDSYSNIYAEVDSIEIYTDNPHFLSYGRFYQADETVQASDWFQRALEQTSVFWTPLVSVDKYGNEYWNLSLVRKIPMTGTPYHGVLVIRVSDNYLKTRINTREYSSMASVDEGPVFFSTDMALYGQKQIAPINYEEKYYQYQGNIRMGEKICFAAVSSLPMYQSDSRIYICTINDQAYANIWDILFICFIIIGVALLLPGIIIHFFTAFFTSRLQTLRNAMHEVSNENYKIEASLQGEDEVSEAFSDLQVMVEKIEQKEAEIYETRLKEQELSNQQKTMEFKMLSSQINPHFLYNTLETIRMKAFTAGDREVATAIKLLGKSMRYVLENTGTAFTTLSKELAHVQTYLAIQKLRFGEKFESLFEIDERINTEAVYILPLLLQPVVENAILHGMEETEAEGLIRISVQKKKEENFSEEVFHIDVSDNGQGMDEETLSRLRESIEIMDMSRKRSIGLYNINQRIKLCYGQEYGIRIFSGAGEGTTVRLVIPAEKSFRISVNVPKEKMKN